MKSTCTVDDASIESTLALLGPYRDTTKSGCFTKHLRTLYRLVTHNYKGTTNVHCGISMLTCLPWYNIVKPGNVVVKGLVNPHWYL